MRDAIKAAGDNGGGTVFFGPGRWYVDGPLLLPHAVLLKGARMDLTAIYFSQATSQSSPGNATAPASLITTDQPVCMEHCADKPHAPRFGVEDLAIYVLSYYNNVIDIRNDTVGVRVRASAFAPTHSTASHAVVKVGLATAATSRGSSKVVVTTH